MPESRSPRKLVAASQKSPARGGLGSFRAAAALENHAPRLSRASIFAMATALSRARRLATRRRIHRFAGLPGVSIDEDRSRWSVGRL
jgi:hypothetical protein